MYLAVGGVGSFTTELAFFGLNHDGLHTNWFKNNGVPAGWNYDGLWCWIEADGAQQYTGGDYRHSAQGTRFEGLRVLDAVADCIDLTTVLTDEGQLLTQSSFMVKNNEKQFQKFKLPKGAEFWSSYVNGQPAKPERDGEWLLVPLPRDANRDQAFAVDIVYAQKINLKSSLFARRVELADHRGFLQSRSA